jgi:Tol biopolymer transport system component
VKIFDTPGCYEAAISPDAKDLAYARLVSAEAGAVEIRPLGGGEPRRICDVKGILLGVCWSPDKKRIAFCALDDLAHKEGPHLYVVGVDGKGLRRFDPPDRIFPRWSPDGKSIAFAILDERKHRGALALIDVESGAERVLFDSEKTVLGVGWSPDGSTIAFTAVGESKSSVIYTIPTAGGTPKVLVESPPAARVSVDYADDGKAIYESILDIEGNSGGFDRVAPLEGHPTETSVLEGPRGSTYAGSGASLVLLWSQPVLHPKSSPPPAPSAR